MKAGASTPISTSLKPASSHSRMSNGDASTAKNKPHDFALVITKKVQHQDTPSLKPAPKPDLPSGSPDPILLATQSNLNGITEALGIGQVSSGKKSASLTVPEDLNGDTGRSIVKNNKARQGGSGKRRVSFTLEVASKTKPSSQQKVNGVKEILKEQSEQQPTLLTAHLDSATSSSGPGIQLSSHLNPSSSSSSSSVSLPSIPRSVGNSHLGTTRSPTLSLKKAPPQHPLAAIPVTSTSSSKIHAPTILSHTFSLEFVKSKPNTYLSEKALGKQALRLSGDRREGEAKKRNIEIIEETVTESEEDATVTTTLSATPVISLLKVNRPSGLLQKSDQLAISTLKVKRKIGRPLKSDHDLKRPRRKKKIRLEEPVFSIDPLRAKLMKGIIVDRPPPLPPSLFAHNDNYLPYSLIPRVFPSLRLNKQLPQQMEDSSSPPPPPLSSPVSFQHPSPATYLASATHRRTNRLFTQAPLPCATALPASLSSNLTTKHKRTLSNSTASPEELDHDARLRGWASSFRELIPLSFEEEFEESDSDECNPLDPERRSTYMPGSGPLKNVRWTLHGTDVGAGWVRNGGHFPGGVGRWGAADWRPNKDEDEAHEEDMDSQIDEEITEDEREYVEGVEKRLEEEGEGGSNANHGRLPEDIQMTELSSGSIEYDSSDED